jgi:serine/threonine protein kinase
VPTSESWLALLHERLTRTLDGHIEPLGKQGASGALFKVTLSSHGYTVVAKGTVPRLVQALRHEAHVYEHLRALQGISVPVHLWAVNLVHPYYYDFQVRIVHLMFLSWAGNCLDEGGAREEDRRIWTRGLVRSLHDIHQAGVLHGDIRGLNALWNGEVCRVMLIDFERSIISRFSTTQPLSPTSGNLKRKRSAKKSELCRHDWNENNGNFKNRGLDYDYGSRLELTVAMQVFT